MQSEEAATEPDGSKATVEPDEGNAPVGKTAPDTVPGNDVSSATLAKTLEKPKSPAKGILKTKTYGLKKKPNSKCTFKCPACETWKSSVQRLNAHYK